MEIDSWALAAVVIKFFGLLAMAGVVGGSFVHLLADRLQFSQLARLRGYLLLCAALGMLMVPLSLLLQVGGINQNGVAGMFDSRMAAILLQSALGPVLALRLTALALTPAAVWLLAMGETSALRQRAGYSLCAMLTLLLGFSFVLTGHTTTMPLAVKMLLGLHVLAVFAWIGALYPLLHLSYTSQPDKVPGLMRGFGALALWLVAALLLAGVYVLTQLLQAPQELLNTSYGQTLLLKLAGVSVLLLLAALNKLVLVPRLLVSGASALQASIRLEMAVALYVVAVTSWLTTVSGPVGS